MVKPAASGFRSLFAPVNPVKAPPPWASFYVNSDLLRERAACIQTLVDLGIQSE